MSTAPRGAWRVLQAVQRAFRNEAEGVLETAFKHAADELGTTSDAVAEIAAASELNAEGRSMTFRGPECAYLHGGIRYVSTGHCVQCQRNNSARQHTARRRKKF